MTSIKKPAFSERGEWVTPGLDAAARKRLMDMMPMEESKDRKEAFLRECMDSTAEFGPKGSWPPGLKSNGDLWDSLDKFAKGARALVKQIAKMDPRVRGLLDLAALTLLVKAPESVRVLSENLGSAALAGVDHGVEEIRLERIYDWLEEIAVVAEKARQTVQVGTGIRKSDARAHSLSALVACAYHAVFQKPPAAVGWYPGLVDALAKNLGLECGDKTMKAGIRCCENYFREGDVDQGTWTYKRVEKVPRRALDQLTERHKKAAGLVP